MRRKTLPLLTLTLLLGASPLLAYTIYLKDGSTLLAREKYKVSGSTAMIVLPNGSQTTLPLAQIDVNRTQASNASDYGDATVLAQPTTQQLPPGQGPSVSEILGNRRTVFPVQVKPPAPPPAPAPKAPAAPSGAAPAVATAANSTAGNTTLARTPAGYLDFMRAPRTPITRVDLGTQIGERLRAHGLESAGIYDGSSPRRVLVEVTGNSEGAVFQAIAAAAQTALDIEAKQPGALEGIELFIATDRRARAGQFLITAERARELQTRQIDLTGFFIKYVEF